MTTSWKHHSVLNATSYILLAVACKYFNLSFKSYKDNIDFLCDLYKCLPVLIFISAMIEKLFKENWVLLDTFRKSEFIFRNIFESLNEVVYVVDFNKRVLFSNKKGN